MLEMNSVTKTFGTFKALDNLTLTVPQGAVYGLVGPSTRRWTASRFTKTPP